MPDLKSLFHSLRPVFLRLGSAEPPGYRDGVSVVPRDKISYGGKLFFFFGGAKFVCTSVSERSVIIMVFLSIILLTNTFK